MERMEGKITHKLEDGSPFHLEFVKAIIVAEMLREEREWDLEKKRQFSYRIKPDLDQQMKLTRCPSQPSLLNPGSSFRAQGDMVKLSVSMSF